MVTMVRVAQPTQQIADFLRERGVTRERGLCERAAVAQFALRIAVLKRELKAVRVQLEKLTGRGSHEPSRLETE